MTVFADALDLRTAVIEHVRNPGITDVFPRLVKMAETTFNRRLRCREQVSTASVVITGGVAALPTDFQEVIGVYTGAGIEYIAQPLQVLQEVQSRGYFGISGTNIMARNDETLTLQYYAKIPTIADDLTDTNWLLEKHPGLYLYAVGLEAAKYLRDVETAQATNTLVEMEFTAAATEDAQQRYSRARVRVQGVTP
jgi:hypothetical protein